MAKVVTAEESRTHSLATERWAVRLILLFTMLTLSHFVHDRWYGMDPAPRDRHIARIAPATANTATGTLQTAPKPMGYAPNVYRVGMPFLVSMLEKVLPVHWSVLLSLTDFCFGFVGLYALYRVLVDDPTLAPVGTGSRAATILGFLTAVALPLNWIVPWQRPETMPSACYLALASCCLLRLKRGIGWFALLLLLTLLQALTRSDVAATFGLALLLTGLVVSSSAHPGGRRNLLLGGAGVLAVAVATQAYLQLVVFPHAVYPPDTPVVVLPYNFSLHNLNVFTLAVGPFAVALGLGFARYHPWRPTDIAAIAAAGIYLPVWFVIGSTAEVRIFVPFLLLLSVPVSRVLASLLTANDGQSFQTGIE